MKLLTAALTMRCSQCISHNDISYCKYLKTMILLWMSLWQLVIVNYNERICPVWFSQCDLTIVDITARLRHGGSRNRICLLCCSQFNKQHRLATNDARGVRRSWRLWHDKRRRPPANATGSIAAPRARRRSTPNPRPACWRYPRRQKRRHCERRHEGRRGLCRSPHTPPPRRRASALPAGRSTRAAGRRAAARRGAAAAKEARR